MPVRQTLTAALATVAFAVPALAHDPVDIQPDFDPTIVWFDFPKITTGSSGRVRLVSADGQSDAALDLEEYYFYQLRYRKALFDFGMRRSIHTAERLARQRAFLETLQRYPDIQMNVQGASQEDIDETLRLFPTGLGVIPRQ